MPASTLGRDQNVFLNVPYDPEYEPLYLALITGLCALGLTPRSVVETPRGKDRLSRLVALLRDCKSSVHDLSRVKLSEGVQKVPRFNMPFELGIAVAIADQTPSHRWFMLESKAHRVLKSLSDVNGYDAFIHKNTQVGMLKAIMNMFEWEDSRPTLLDLRELLADVRGRAKRWMRDYDLDDLFEKRGFGVIVAGVQTVVLEHRPRWK